jgi:hypothetical protein
MDSRMALTINGSARSPTPALHQSSEAQRRAERLVEEGADRARRPNVMSNR